MSEEPSVTYGVKELLEQMNRRLTDIVQLMGTKADQSHVQRLEDRVEGHATDIHELKLARANEREHHDHRHTLWGLLIAAAGVAAAVLTIVLNGH